MTDIHNGTVKIKNGIVKVNDPTGLGSYPKIIPGEHVEIFIDGELVKEEAVVDSQREIVIETHKTEPEIVYNLIVSKNGLAAYLKLEVTPGIKTKVANSGPGNEVLIRGEVEKKEYPRVDIEEVLKLLDKNGIVYGIQKKNLEDLTDIKDTREVIIAKGEPPEKGHPGEVIPVKTTDLLYQSPFNFIASFSIGEIIAYKVPAIPGKAGKNVFGELIEPPEVSDVELIAGEGVTLSNDGKKAIAIRSGMPKIKKSGKKVKVMILPSYVVEGDINKYTGNLGFKGDLIVKGNIKDYFNVKTGNNLFVEGNIANSEINTRGNVIVLNNIISSRIIAGVYLREELELNMVKLRQRIEQLLYAYEQIIGEAMKRLNTFQRYNQAGKILRLFFANKFKDIIVLMKEVSDAIEGMDVFSDLRSSLNKILQFSESENKILQMNDIELFNELKNMLGSILDEEKNSAGQKNVFANYIQNSYLMISGNVSLVEKGCYNSQIYAGGRIVVLGKEAKIQGGSYEARAIFAREVGSKLSVTNFWFSDEMYIERVIGDIYIKAPHDRIKIIEEKKNLYIKVNPLGRIQIQTKKPQLDEVINTSRYEYIPMVREQ
ncbi:MAG: FapA family protein [Halanaerobium sp.]|nr:FapA family protein [Halanaerobium sp.]